MRVLGRSLPFFAALGLAGALFALPFLTFRPGFTQELWGVSPGFMGGMAFAPDGDLWVTSCNFSGSPLRRFDAQSTFVDHGTTLHPQIAQVASVAGCGLVNHPNGQLYSNTSGGVTRMSAATGLPIPGAFGPPGNALGIAVHPVTLELVYVGNNGVLNAVTPDFSSTRVFSSVLSGNFVDGIFFAPIGDYLFTATRTSPFRVTILDGTTGALVQHVVVPREPDGIVFHATLPTFVLTVDTTGTMTALSFPGDRFDLPPDIFEFAAGGFRGDIPMVGPDGYLYLPQAGTRYDDGVITSANSVVRVGAGFSPPPGVSPIALEPLSSTPNVGSTLLLTATIIEEGVPLAAREVRFEVLNGPHGGLTSFDFTDASGQAHFSYTGFAAGGDIVQARYTSDDGRTLVSNVSLDRWQGGDCQVLDFRTEDDGVTTLVNGQHIDDEFGGLVTISATGPNAGAAIFDASFAGPNNPGDDPDLLANTGNILILQDQNAPPDANDIFPEPGDDRDGGTLRFDFATAVAPRGIRLIDIDGTDGLHRVILTDTNGRQRIYAVPAGWTGDRTSGEPGQRTLDLTLLTPQPGFQATATASQASGFAAEAVVRLEVQLAGSGGVDDLVWCPPGTSRAHAVANVRNGTDVNPRSLENVAAPVLGGHWVARLDCAAPSGFASVFGFSQALTGPRLGAGEILVGGRRLFGRSSTHGVWPAQFSEALPRDLALLGLTACVQGLCRSSSGAQLSNAVDLTFGY